VKYRGSTHGTNEYPFLIDQEGMSVVPITSVVLEHGVSLERISTGVPRLDTMLGDKGFYRGSSILVSGTAGTGKSSLGVAFADAACERGEKCLYFAFEEAQAQISRNMKSIGFDLDRWIKKGLLTFKVARPTLYGLEMHLTTMHKQIAMVKPSVVVVDPITSLLMAGSRADIQALLLRLLDDLKSTGVTVLLTTLTAGGSPLEATDFGVSSMVDTWIALRDIDNLGERNRSIHIIKSRGMAHSNQIREFLLTDKGIDLVDVYAGSGKVLAGSARIAQEAAERAEATQSKDANDRLGRAMARKREAMEARLEAIRAEFDAEAAEMAMELEGRARAQRGLATDRQAMRESRRADQAVNGASKSRKGVGTGK